MKTDELRVETARWSLMPPWSDTLKTKFPTFNARSEGITSKATWKGPTKVTPVHRAGHWVLRVDRRERREDAVVASPEQRDPGFAGLYSWWQDKSLAEDDPARWTLTATILTMPTIGNLAEIHDRNPVGLPESLWEQWMDPNVTGDENLVDEAVNASQAQMDALDFHRVLPFKSTDDGPRMTVPA